jgi:hypothetical protein
MPIMLLKKSIFSRLSSGSPVLVRRHSHYRAITPRLSGHYLWCRSVLISTHTAQHDYSGAGSWFRSAPPCESTSDRHPPGLTRCLTTRREGERVRMLEEIVRCPYCVQGSEFRPMIRRSGEWFVCVSCGHTATSDDPYAKCPCPKCREVTRLATRRRSSEEPRNRPDLPARL